MTELLKAASVSESSKEGATVKNFLNTLADNNRLSILGGACEKFDELMSASRGEVELRITSAEELDKRILQKLEQTVQKSKYVGSGRKLKVVPRVCSPIRPRASAWRLFRTNQCWTQVSPDIRGGLIVEIGDRTIDLSVASKISRMNKLLQDTL